MSTYTDRVEHSRNETTVTIPDEVALTGATEGRFDTRYRLRVWDDGFGTLWIYTETMGPLGIVRAQSFESAWECVLDEILQPIGEDELADAYDPDGGGDREKGELAEGYHYQSNTTGTGIVCEDLNGSRLEPLTQRHIDELGIKLVLSEDD